MPHCDLHLYENLLRENWSRAQLPNVLLIANRLSEYAERCVSPPRLLRSDSFYLLPPGPSAHCSSSVRPHWLPSPCVLRHFPSLTLFPAASRPGSSPQTTPASRASVRLPLPRLRPARSLTSGSVFCLASIACTSSAVHGAPTPYRIPPNRHRPAHLSVPLAMISCSSSPRAASPCLLQNFADDVQYLISLAARSGPARRTPLPSTTLLSNLYVRLPWQNATANGGRSLRYRQLQRYRCQWCPQA